MIITGSPTEIANERLVARIGDAVANKAPYIATIVTGSPDTLAAD